MPAQLLRVHPPTPPQVDISWKNSGAYLMAVLFLPVLVLLLSPLGELVDLARGLKIHDSRGS